MRAPLDSVVHSVYGRLFLVFAVVFARAPVQDSARLVSLLDNGDFAESLPERKDSAGLRRVPWWRTPRGAEHIVELEGRPCLVTDAGERVAQPIAAYTPLVAGLVVRGEVSGSGSLFLIGGDGAQVFTQLQGASDGAGFAPFEIDYQDFVRVQTGSESREPLSPRFTLELRGGPNATARWRALEVLVPLPELGVDALRERVVAELEWIFALWLERARDDFGPRHTAFLASRFDILDGRLLTRVPGGHNIFFDLLLAACELERVPAWCAARDAFLTDFLELGLNSGTGLPQLWDVERDEAIDSYVEIAEALRFLVDLAERGPASFRQQARTAALRIAETVLAHGVLPDGRVAAKYRPSDGASSTDVAALRQLDLPAQLGRLGALVDEPRYRDVALRALAAFEYAHAWPGTWDSIDPGFDDQYGHYGARAAVLWRSWPDQAPFRRVARGGLAHFAPLWADALRLGGNVAADQVRCWRIARDVARLDPASLPQVAELLRAAARSHFKGEQYGDGTWGDVTLFGFDPQPHLQVGDLTGVPQNLLEGLALMHDAELAAAGGLSLAEARAMFSAVFESSRAAYRRPFGYLAGREEQSGDNASLGSLRMAAGLVAMLAGLDAR